MTVTCTCTCEGNVPVRVIVSRFEPKSLVNVSEIAMSCMIVLEQIIKNSLNILNRNHFFSVYVSTYYTKNIIVCCTGLSETLKSHVIS